MTTYPRWHSPLSNSLIPHHALHFLFSGALPLNILYNLLIMFIIYFVSLTLEYKPSKKKSSSSLCSLMYAKHLKLSLAHIRYSVNIC